MTDLDKYYTKPEIVDICLSTLNEFSPNLWVEPSAGAGAFSSKLKCLAMDILPEANNIVQQDFLTWSSSNKVGIFGNPPFGKNSSLAIKFFNHAAKYAEVIAFILPRTFKKISVQNKLDLNWVLYHEQDLPLNSFTFEGKPYSVPCVWQIWIPGKRVKVMLPTNHIDWQWVSKAEANYAIRRVGGLAGKVFKEFEQYAQTSNYFIKCTDEVANRITELYTELQNVSKNTAGNPSLSKTELVATYTESYNEQTSSRGTIK